MFAVSKLLVEGADVARYWRCGRDNDIVVGLEPQPIAPVLLRSAPAMVEVSPQMLLFVMTGAAHLGAYCADRAHYRQVERWYERKF